MIKKRTSWSKGLTKETDERLRKMAERVSKAKKGKPNPHKGRAFTSNETRRKISEGNKGRIPWNKGLTMKDDSRIKPTKKSLEGRKKISLAHRGKIVSEKTRKKLSEIAKERYKDPTKNPMYGCTLSDETKEKISKAKTGKKISEEHKQKISVANKGRKLSLETKKKMREARLKRTLPIRDTSIEIMLQNELKKRRIVFQKHITLFNLCQPDIVFKKRKVAVFADGDYWHSKDFDNGKRWKRDRMQDKQLMKSGWIPLRFWGHEIRENSSNCVDIIENTLEMR